MFIRSSVRAHRIFILCALKSLPRNLLASSTFVFEERDLFNINLRLEDSIAWSHGHSLNADPRTAVFFSSVRFRTIMKPSFIYLQKTFRSTLPFLEVKGGYFCFIFYFFQYFIQHCFIYRPSDSNVSEDAGIEKLVCKESLLYPKTDPTHHVLQVFILFHRLEGSHSIASGYAFRTRIFSFTTAFFNK
jgi:hypothetical protein